MQGSYDYGYWPLVIIHSIIFIVFAFSFTKPKTKRDWRSLGAFSAFIVALFTEMYGFPLTIYLLSGWLQSRFPGLDVFSHESGHLWGTVLGLNGNSHFNPIHVLSNVLILGGFIVLARAWKVLHKAQQEGTLATEGPYASVRHPQYSAFVVIMLGFLFQWPTLLTLVMFPVLVWMYVALARREEREVRATLGEVYGRYAENTPAFFPYLGNVPREAKAEARSE
ncbi:MAG: isoprenylcysteine carboxylmethyltransferase family protein [Rhodothermales bacterium]|nr:isoprenylcysteine carboxylmethyltransferase family protein [Rhodothermales bacterium]